MSKIIHIDLEYTDNGIFYGGNSVYGELIIEARAPITPSEVFIECIGEVRVLRHSHVGNALGCVLPIYKKGYVIRRRVNATGHISRDSRTSRIPFNFILVRPCPQSLESGRLGHVRYWCQARVNLGPSKKDQFFVSRSFTVLEEVDLNASQDPQNALGVSRGQNVLPVCCLAAMGRVEAELTLNKKHYVPGENISAKFTVDNQSRMKVRSIHLLLIQTIGKSAASFEKAPKISLVQQPACGCTQYCITRGYSLVAARVDYSGLESGDTLYMPRARVHIPALPCSSEGLAGRVEGSTNPKPPPAVPISYAVMLIAHMGRRPTRDLIISQSVLLGSIPHLADESESAISASSHTPSFVESACSASAYMTTTTTGHQHPVHSGGGEDGVASLQFAPTYVYYPTIGLASGAHGVADGETPRGVKRRSILKRTRPNSGLTDTTSMTSSWISQSQTSLSTRFETPV